MQEVALGSSSPLGSFLRIIELSPFEFMNFPLLLTSRHLATCSDGLLSTLAYATSRLFYIGV